MSETYIERLKRYSQNDKLIYAMPKVKKIIEKCEELQAIKDEAERIKAEAHLKADHYAYDLMRTVLKEKED